MASPMMTTGWVSGRSASLKLRPRRISRPTTSKNSGSTAARYAMKAPWSVGGSNPSTLKSLELVLSGFRCRFADGADRLDAGERPEGQVDDGLPSVEITKRFLVLWFLCRYRHRNHKWRNAIGHLPERLHASVGKALRDAWDLDSADRAARVLERLAGRWSATTPARRRASGRDSRRR